MHIHHAYESTYVCHNSALLTLTQVYTYIVIGYWLLKNREDPWLIERQGTLPIAVLNHVVGDELSFARADILRYLKDIFLPVARV